MNQRTVSVLACRLLALWMFYQASLLMGSVLLILVIAVTKKHPGGLSSDQFESAMMAGGIPGAIACALALGFWFGSVSIARWMVDRRMNDEDSSMDMNGETILTIALVVVGCMVMFL